MDTDGAESIPIQTLNTSTSNTTTTTSPGHPEELSTITLLLVSGEKAKFQVSLTSTIISFKQHIYENWPDNFPERPGQLNSLRLVYLGKFLDDSASLDHCKIPHTDNTIIHLNIMKQPIGELRGVVPSKASETAPKCSCIIQ
ncbi:hypothetical protein CONCODRAFT_78142 [Conidiobolus coronatus NRRL 28638]|uniref:Ubiquitin-like domain-containing protein n=1 Tax=Conidiobolus coronatus (strain ATCC 28846 / CBS 209.66 / NRRL 28638) TaxID=796925 RepID=A0A137PA16_CONC2|nr:hypothetical protein CONCODRAFT_78142 [Conidiobolus coronatus NRRL 28638]|eukprot:KXN71840.1 hypothetical protein CONCODRAFT_78142 [Conidiobolus coronatus NRRL 28638]